MEIAFCTVLLVSAVLLAQSLVRVLRANAWGNVSHVLTLSFFAPTNHYRRCPIHMRAYRIYSGPARSACAWRWALRLARSFG